MRATIVRAAADEVSRESSRAAAASRGRDDCANVDAMIGRGGGPVDFAIAATLPSHPPETKPGLATPSAYPPSYLSSAKAPRRVLLEREGGRYRGCVVRCDAMADDESTTLPFVVVVVHDHIKLVPALNTTLQIMEQLKFSLHGSYFFLDKYYSYVTRRTT